MRGIVRVDVILSIGLFILLFGVLVIYIRSLPSDREIGGFPRTITLDRLLDNWIDAKTEVELFFVNSSVGYVNVSLKPGISFNPNATRAYLLPDWNGTEVWVLSDEPLKVLVNATTEKYVIVVSNKPVEERYVLPPPSTINDSKILHVEIQKLFDEEKIPLINSTLIRKNLGPFRIEILKDGEVKAYSGFNISSFQNIYQIQYPWLCINNTADVYECTVRVMTW